MADAFKSVTFNERRQAVRGFLLLVAVLAFASFVAYWHLGTQGPMVEGRVVAFGARADDHGELPVLTVQLQDGTTHIVLASKAEIARCQLGSRISLVPRSAGLRVGVRGCNLP